MHAGRSRSSLFAKNRHRHVGSVAGSQNVLRVVGAVQIHEAKERFVFVIHTRNDEFIPQRVDLGPPVVPELPMPCKMNELQVGWWRGSKPRNACKKGAGSAAGTYMTRER